MCEHLLSELASAGGTYSAAGLSDEDELQELLAELQDLAEESQKVCAHSLACN